MSRVPRETSSKNEEEKEKNEEVYEPTSLFEISSLNVAKLAHELPNHQWDLLPLEVRRKVLNLCRDKKLMTHFQPNFLVFFAKPSINSIYSTLYSQLDLICTEGPTIHVWNQDSLQRIAVIPANFQELPNEETQDIVFSPSMNRYGLRV